MTLNEELCFKNRKFICANKKITTHFINIIISINLLTRSALSRDALLIHHLSINPLLKLWFFLKNGLLVSSNLDISVAIDDCTRLSNIISELRQYAHVLVEDRMTIVSVVGNMQWEYAGFEAKIMEALKDIPLRMISYGSSNNDVAFVIKNTDQKRALQALNDKLFQPEYAERN